MTVAAGIPSGAVRPRELAAATAFPTFAQAWAPPDCLRPDFVAGLQLTHTIPALRDDAFSGASTLRALAARCTRSVEFVLGAQAPGDCAALTAALRRFVQAPCSVPLWSEQAELTADVFGGFQNYVECDPSWRLFAEGQRVMVVDAEAASGPFGQSAYPAGSQGAAQGAHRRGMAWPFFELRTIKVGAAGGAVRTDRIITEDSGGADPILRSFRRGARVVPMLDVDAPLSVQAEQLSARHMRVRLALRERGGAGPVSASAIGLDAAAYGALIPPLTTYGAAPAGAPTYDGLPILDLRFQPGRTRLALSRPAASSGGESVRLAPAARGPRGRERLDVECLAFTRDRARRLLQFFESRGGMALPFWCALPGERLRLAPAAAGATTISGTTLTIERTNWSSREPAAVFGALGAAAGLPDRIVVEERDPSSGAITRHARRVTARVDTVQSGQPVERLTLDSALPVIQRDRVLAVAWLARVRFGGESIVEQWIDGRHARSAFTLEEVLDERSVDAGAARDPAEPCAECLLDLGDACPGSAAWDYPIPVAGAGSPERAACDLNAQNDLVLGAGAAIRLAGAFRYLDLTDCFGTTKVVDLVDAAWDVSLPRDPSIWPTDLWRMDTGVVELAPSARTRHRFLDAGSNPCAGAAYTPGMGSEGRLAVNATWRNARSGTSTRMYARIAGLKNPGDDWMSDDYWYVDITALGSGGFFLGGGLGASSFAPFFVPWNARITSATGITALAASFAYDYGGGGFVEFSLTMHVCPLVSCAAEGA